MNRIAKRSFTVTLLALLLLGGFVFFLVEYAMNAPQWAVADSSPHVYDDDRFQSGTVYDRDGNILLQMQDRWTYSSDPQIRKATLHWIGDREGNIQVPAVPNYYDQVLGFDYLNGIYTYGGIGSGEGSVQLTVSAQLQSLALEQMNGRKGTIAVYNYKTGQILCAVTTPTFDPDDLPDIAADPVTYEGAYMNRFVQSAYTPGSIFKVVTLAAALEELPNAAELTFTCTGSWGGGEYPVTCESVHGTQSLKQAFCNSCNCAFAELSGILGSDVLHTYVEKFGITDPVSFDGITTAKGNFEKTENPVSLAWSSIGQYTDLVNPCAYVLFMGAIAGDGSGAMPYVVAKADDGQEGYMAQTAFSSPVISSQTAQTVQEYMRYNVTAKYGADHFPGLTVCAKTGTAEKDDGIAPTAMFTGFVMDAQYPLAFIVCVEEGGYGASTCIPIASRVLTACKQYMDS